MSCIDHRPGSSLGKLRRLDAVATLFIIITGVFSAASTLAAPGTLLWEDQIDQAARADFAVAVAAAHGKVVAVGWTTNTARNRDILVRAYDGASGSLQWQDKFDFTGGIDSATSVVAAENVVVVGGSATNKAGNSNWLVRAYELTTGKLLWQDVAQTGGASEQVYELATDGHRVFAAGVSANGTTNTSQLITRAYDLRNGALAWEAGVNGVRADSASIGLAIHSGLAFAAASITDGSLNNGAAFLVQAYDSVTGKSLWQDRVSNGAAHKITVKSGRVYAVGTSNNNWLVRAYDGRSGQVLWNDSYCLTCGQLDVENAAFQVAADDQRVVISGYGSAGGAHRAARDWVVRAYDAKNGQNLWTDRMDYAGSLDQATGGIAIDNGQVFSYGTVFSAASLQDLLIRTYDANSGTVLWQDRVDKAAVADETFGDGRGGLAVDQGRVTIVGGSGIRRANGVIDTDWIVRTYDTRQLQN